MPKIKFEDKEIEYKIVFKPIKHLYLEVKDDFVEIRCNRFVPRSYIEKFILKHIDNILLKLENRKFCYFLGEKILNNQNEKELYKKNAKKVILPIVKKYSEKMNVKVERINFKFYKSKWGSCNYKNEITFNNYLLKFPIEIIEYVVVHELAHIVYKNHSKKFWGLVEKFLPDYKKRIKKLRKYEKTM